MTMTNEQLGVGTRMSVAHYVGRATSAADKLNANAKFKEHVEKTFASKGWLNVAPFYFWEDCTDAFGDEMDLWPYPGTELNEPHPKTGTKYIGNNPDKYELSKTSKGRTPKSSFYRDTAEKTEFGIEQLALIADMKSAKQTKDGGGRNAKNADYNRMSNADLDTLIAEADGKIETIKQHLEKVAKFHLLLQSITNHIKDVKVDIATQKNGAFLESPSNIIVADNRNPKVDCMAMSLNTFLRLRDDIAIAVVTESKAKAKAENNPDAVVSGYIALTDTLSREQPEEDEDDEDENSLYPVITSKEVFGVALSRVVDFLGQPEYMAALVGWLRRAKLEEKRGVLEAIAESKLELTRLAESVAKEIELLAEPPSNQRKAS